MKNKRLTLEELLCRIKNDNKESLRSWFEFEEKRNQPEYVEEKLSEFKSAFPGIVEGIKHEK